MSSKCIYQACWHGATVDVEQACCDPLCASLMPLSQQIAALFPAANLQKHFPAFAKLDDQAFVRLTIADLAHYGVTEIVGATA